MKETRVLLIWYLSGNCEERLMQEPAGSRQRAPTTRPPPLSPCWGCKDSTSSNHQIINSHLLHVLGVLSRRLRTTSFGLSGPRAVTQHTWPDVTTYSGVSQHRFFRLYAPSSQYHRPNVPSWIYVSMTT